MTQTAAHLTLVPLEGDLLPAEDTTAEAAVTPQEARDLFDSVALALRVSWAGLGRAYATKAWKVCPRKDDPSRLGYSSWEEACAVEFADAQARRLAPAARRPIFGELHREFRMSARAIEAATGYNKSTVAADLRTPEAGCAEVTEVLSRDGKLTPKRNTRRPTPVVVEADPEPRTVVLLRLAGQAGEAGLTVRDFEKATGWGREVLSPALSRLAASRRLTYRPGAKRGVMGTYVRP
jgi:hypothetical protein